MKNFYLTVFMIFSHINLLLAAEPAKITNIDIYYENELTLNRQFNVGDQIEIRIHAEDPNNLPIEYMAKRYRRNIYERDLFDWNPASSFFYTFVEQDSVSGFQIIVGAKNNDGIDYEENFGDSSSLINFNVR